jgi:hypothetical protein
MAVPSILGDNTAKADAISGPGGPSVSFGGSPPSLIGDKTVHGETITGPGSAPVTVEGRVLSLVGDNTTAVIRKNRREMWGPGPITGPGPSNITVGK